MLATQSMWNTYNHNKTGLSGMKSNISFSHTHSDISDKT